MSVLCHAMASPGTGGPAHARRPSAGAGPSPVAIVRLHGPAAQQTAGQHIDGGNSDEDGGGAQKGFAGGPARGHNLPGRRKPDDGCDIGQPLKKQQTPVLARQKQ
jgi:hypothetical protein